MFTSAASLAPRAAGLLARLLALLLAAPLALAALASCSREPPAPVASPPAPAPAAARPVPRSGDRARADRHLGNARSAADRAQARREYDLALAADPAHREALAECGWFLLEPEPGQDAGLALLCFLDQVALAPDDRVARAGEGIARAASGDGAGGRPLLEAAEADGDVMADGARASRIEHALGRLDGEAGDLANATRRLRRAVELEPVPLRGAEPLASLGEFHAEQGSAADAERFLREALDRDAEHTKARYLLGRLLTRNGRKDEGAVQLEIRSLLEELHRAPGREGEPALAERLKWRERLLALEPDRVAFRAALARVLLAARRFADARTTLAPLGAAAAQPPEIAFLAARACAGLHDRAGVEAARAGLAPLDAETRRRLDLALIDEWRRAEPPTSEAELAEMMRRWE